MLAFTANLHRDPKKRSKPYEPHEFDPHMQAPPAEPIEVLQGKEADAVLRRLCSRGGGK